MIILVFSFFSCKKEQSSDSFSTPDNSQYTSEITVDAEISEEETDFSNQESTSPPKTTQTDVLTCTVSVNCKSILGNADKLRKGKEAFLPSDGIILDEITVEFEDGETVFDVLKKVCASCVCEDECEYCLENGIQLESSYTPGYDNYYIEGIHQIYEKDCGSKSGWMYKVNGVFPNYGCSSYHLENGDRIEWVYTCELGEDIGADI